VEVEMSRGWSLVLAWLVGCGSVGARDASVPPAAPPAIEVAGFASLDRGIGGELAGSDQDVRRAAATTRVQIETGSISLEVDAYEPARESLVHWVEAHGGHLADESLNRTDGQASYGTMRVRVPTDQLEPLLSWIQEEHEVTHLQVHRTDVTAEWVDLDARLRALHATEERLLGLLADRTADLKDVLAAETELSRIRGEIESLEGRRRVLADQVALATLDLSIAVRTPFAPLVEEALGHELGRAFTGSLAAMGQVGRGLLIVAAALAPWLLMLGGAATAVMMVLRALVVRARR
jgi:hypothetical protein